MMLKVNLKRPPLYMPAKRKEGEDMVSSDEGREGDVSSAEGKGGVLAGSLSLKATEFSTGAVRWVIEAS